MTTAATADVSAFPAACRAFAAADLVRLRGLRVAGPAGTAARLCFSSDGRWLLVAGEGGAALWDAARGSVVWPGDAAGLALAPAISPGAARAAWATGDGTITVRGLPREGVAHDTFVVDPGARPIAQAFGVDGRVLVTIDAAGQLRGLAFERGEVAWTSRCEGLGALARAALARDARLAAAVAGDGTCALVYPQTGTCLFRLGEPGSVRSVTLSADGQRVLAGSAEGARLWDAASGALLRRLPGPGADAVALSPGDGRAVGVGHDGKLVLWDTAGGHALERLDLGGFLARVHDVAFAPDGRTFVVAGDTRRAVTPGASGREAVLLRFEPRP